MDNNDQFERLYNHLEDLLRSKYRLDPTASAIYVHERHVPAQVAGNLRSLRELRNYLVHDKRDGTVRSVVVTEEALAFLQRLIDGIERPKKAIDVCVPKDRMLVATLDSPLLPLVRVMLERNISHLPILTPEGLLAGVFSGTVVFAEAAADGSFRLSQESRVKDLERFLPIRAHVENYWFVARETPLEEIIELFGGRPQNGRKMKMLFVTEHGRPEERILGLITPWDILDDEVVPA